MPRPISLIKQIVAAVIKPRPRSANRVLPIKAINANWAARLAAWESPCAPTGPSGCRARCQMVVISSCLRRGRKFYDAVAAPSSLTLRKSGTLVPVMMSMMIAPD